jgi:hypothetical protein
VAESRGIEANELRFRFDRALGMLDSARLRHLRETNGFFTRLAHACRTSEDPFRLAVWWGERTCALRWQGLRSRFEPSTHVNAYNHLSIERAHSCLVRPSLRSRGPCRGSLCTDDCARRANNATRVCLRSRASEWLRERSRLTRSRNLASPCEKILPFIHGCCALHSLHARPMHVPLLLTVQGAADVGNSLLDNHVSWMQRLSKPG